MATVKLIASSNATRAMPARIAAIRIAANCTCQVVEHDKQRELPSDRLRPRWQPPHRIPVRLYAHCASAPFKFIATLASGGKQ